MTAANWHQPKADSDNATRPCARDDGTLVQNGAADGALRSRGGIRGPENLATEVGPGQLVGIPFRQHVLDLCTILWGTRCVAGARCAVAAAAAASSGSS